MEKNQMCFPQKRSCVCIFETCEERNVGGGLFDFFVLRLRPKLCLGKKQKGNRWGPTSHHKPLCICALAVFSQHWDTQCYLHKSQFWKNTCVYIFPLSNKKNSIIAFHRDKNTSLQSSWTTLSHRGMSVRNVALFCHRLLISECIWELMEKLSNLSSWNEIVDDNKVGPISKVLAPRDCPHAHVLYLQN